MTDSPTALRRRAKILKKAFLAGEAEAAERVAAVFGQRETIKHADALHVLALESGFDSWPKLKLAWGISQMDRAARAERLKIALFYGQSHVVDRLLGTDPGLPSVNLGLQIALLDLGAVERALQGDPDVATRTIGVRPPILHLAFSQYWRHVPGGGETSVRMADLLVSNGADVNDSYPSEPGSEHELSALYGALGHSGNLELARWLLENGANPNDDESLYHSTELGHTEGLRLLLDHGAETQGTNALLRAMDFNSLEMVTMLLEAGADPNEQPAHHPSGQPPVVIPALHQAARRMCSGGIAEVLIGHGADGRQPYHGHSAYAYARMRGNRDIAAVLETHGQATSLSDNETLLALAADGKVDGRINEFDLTEESRRLLTRVAAVDGALEHVKRLVALGLDPDCMDEQDMPAIHVAGWEGQADTVAYLLSLGPDLERKNMYGGDLMGTVIHGAEFCPSRATRDHIRCAELVLAAGSRLHRHDIDGCGVEALAEMLADWAEAHPDRVVNDA